MELPSLATFAVVAALFPALIAVLTVRRVADMEAVIVRERLTGRITGLFVGPRWYICLPVIDSVQRLDLHFQLAQFPNEAMESRDGLLANVTLTVGWQLSPTFLVRANLREVLPQLPQVDALVTYWIQNTVRSTVSQHELEELMFQLGNVPAFRQLLANDLQVQVARWGVQITSMDMFCLPAPTVVNVQTDAEAQAREYQTLAAAHATEIRLLRQAMGGNPSPEQLIQLLAVQAARHGDSRLFTALGLGDWSRQNGGVMPQPPAGGGFQGGSGTPQAGSGSSQNPAIHFVVGP